MRTIVATGVTGGIGRAILLGLVRHEDIHAVLIGRDPGKLRELESELIAISPKSRVETLTAELTLLREARKCALAVAERHTAIDILLQSAGLVPAQRIKTEEGVERTLAVSFLTRFLIYRTLQPRLGAAPAPIVFHVAGAGQDGDVRFDDLNFDAGFRPMRTVLQFQQMNDALALQENAAGRVRFYAYNPGKVDTGIHQGWPPLMRFVMTKIVRPLKMQTPERAAAAAIAVLRDPLRYPDALIDWTGRPIVPSARLSDAAYRARTLEAASALIAKAVAL